MKLLLGANVAGEDGRVKGDHSLSCCRRRDVPSLAADEAAAAAAAFGAPGENTGERTEVRLVARAPILNA
jgi:hypothetical protein